MKRIILICLLASFLGGCIPYLVSKYVTDEHTAQMHDGGLDAPIRGGGIPADVGP